MPHPATWGAMGSERTRCPVASKMAFPTAGAIPMMGHSPAPAEVKSLRSHGDGAFGSGFPCIAIGTGASVVASLVLEHRCRWGGRNLKEPSAGGSGRAKLPIIQNSKYHFLRQAGDFDRLHFIARKHFGGIAGISDIDAEWPQPFCAAQGVRRPGLS